MKLIVGLGNPGKQYENTRHNAGFMILDHLVRRFGFDPFLMAEKHKAEISMGQIAEEKILLAKPQTFMNRSGQSVQSIISFYKLNKEDVIVIYDDVELPFGTLRIRSEGSSGGHNGMQSIIDELGTNKIIRVRIGIKPEAPFPGTLEDYVLGKLMEDEKILLSETTERIPNLLETLFTEGLDKAMRQYN